MSTAEIKEVAPGCYVQQVVGGYELNYTTAGGGSTLTVRRPTLESLHDYLAFMNIQIPDLVKTEPIPQVEDQPYVSVSGNTEPAALPAPQAVSVSLDRFDGRKAHFIFSNNGDIDVDVVRTQNDKSGRTLVKVGDVTKRSWRADPGDEIVFSLADVDVELGRFGV